MDKYTLNNVSHELSKLTGPIITILELSALRHFVLDEADQMLSKGFLYQIQDTFEFVPRDTQVYFTPVGHQSKYSLPQFVCKFNIFWFLLQIILVSATLPPEVLDITGKFMRNPRRVLVKREELTLQGIQQFYVNVEREVCLLTDANGAFIELTVLIVSLSKRSYLNKSNITVH